MNAADQPPPTPRNPGPSWGFRFLCLCDRWVPEALFRPARVLGTAAAVIGMPAQRRHSRAYLTHVLPHRPTLLDVFRHFFAFTEFLMLKLRVTNGYLQKTQLAPDAQGFVAFMESGQPALLGSLHLGHSDLLGFLFGPRYRHRVVMVRQRVANSHDIDKLLERAGGWVKILWVNDPANLLFALKEAVAGRASVAMKCDRLEFAAKTEAFEFLGGRREFPFTIYHLGVIFQRPVVHSFGLPSPDGTSIIHSSTVWHPHATASRAENLRAGHEHFQAFLRQVEGVLRQQPYQWFNFLPLNPVATS